MSIFTGRPLRFTSFDTAVVVCPAPSLTVTVRLRARPSAVNCSGTGPPLTSVAPDTPSLKDTGTDSAAFHQPAAFGGGKKNVTLGPNRSSPTVIVPWGDCSVPSVFTAQYSSWLRLSSVKITSKVPRAAPLSGGEKWMPGCTANSGPDTNS